MHTKNAHEAGATREEIAEVVFISSALSAGAVVGHGLLAMRLFSESGPFRVALDSPSQRRQLTALRYASRTRYQQTSAPAALSYSNRHAFG